MFTNNKISRSAFLKTGISVGAGIYVLSYFIQAGIQRVFKPEIENTAANKYSRCRTTLYNPNLILRQLFCGVVDFIKLLVVQKHFVGVLVSQAATVIDDTHCSCLHKRKALEFQRLQKTLFHVIQVVSRSTGKKAIMVFKERLHIGRVIRIAIGCGQGLCVVGCSRGDLAACHTVNFICVAYNGNIRVSAYGV